MFSVAVWLMTAMPKLHMNITPMLNETKKPLITSFILLYPHGFYGKTLLTPVSQATVQLIIIINGICIPSDAHPSADAHLICFPLSEAAEVTQTFLPC